MPSDDARIILFRTRIRAGVENAYGARAEAVYEIARTMPGFVGAKDFTADDGERLAVIEFDSAEHLAAWRTHVEHRAAQQGGRSTFYAEYRLPICALLRESRYVAGEHPELLPSDARPRPEPIDAEGGCACKAVRYRVRGRARFATLRHCADCRLASGATPVAWAVFRVAEVTWLGQAPKERAS